MPQPRIRSDQLNSTDFATITAEGLEAVLGAPIVIGALTQGDSLQYTGSPLSWRNAPATGSGVTAGDGLSSVGGSPLGSQVLSVDSTVARLNVALNTYSFAGALSINLTDTSQAADEDVWRISNSGGQFLIATRTDVDGAGVNAIVIDRTGTTVDSTTFAAPIITTASGTGTSSALQLNSAIPTIILNDTDATASEGVWDITSTSASSALEFRTRTDAHGSGATWLSVVRSGTTVTSIDFAGTAMTFNGAPIQFGSPEGVGGGGSGLGSPVDTPVELAPSNTGGASLRVPAGVAPSSPIPGDLYSTTQGLFFVGHGSPGGITHDLTHPIVSAASTAVLNANNTTTLAEIPGMRVDFVSPSANYLCEVWIRGRQNVADAGVRIGVDSSGFGGSVTWTLTEYDTTFTYGPITVTNGGSPMTYPSGDVNAEDAQIRGMDFGEQNNVTTAVALLSTYNNGAGEFVLRGEGYLTTGGGSVSVNVLGAQVTPTVGNTQFSYTNAGRAWIKLTRITN